jgi:hypothetical protein
MAVETLSAQAYKIRQLSENKKTLRSEDTRALFDFALQAMEEIERLEKRVRELEAQLLSSKR